MDTYEVDDPEAIYSEDWNDKGSIFPPLKFFCLTFVCIIIIVATIVWLIK